jgi:hypothetical protein
LEIKKFNMKEEIRKAEAFYHWKADMLLEEKTTHLLFELAP